MDFDPSKPIWLQLVTEFTRRIATGVWPAGERVPSVREIAADLGVNPNTVQRALAELDRTRLAVAERTAGRFVTTDTALIEASQLELARSAVDAFITQARGLHLDAAAAQRLVRDRWDTAGHPPASSNPSSSHQEDR